MKSINKLIALSFIVSILAACSKQVDLQPTDVVPIERVFTSVNDLEQGVLGVYGTWQGRRPIYLSAVFSDEARQGVGAEYRGVGAILFRWEHTSDAQDFRDAEPGNAWTNMYQVIDRANRVLFYIDNVPATTAADQAQKNRIRGELLALRGFAHFELMRWYAQRYTPGALGIPYMKTYAQDPGNFKPSRQISSEVIANVEEDLAQARSLIPATFTDISRVTRNGVVAMQARVALYTNKWDSAIARSTVVINAQPLTPRAAYPALWTTRNLPNNQSTEVIWKLNVNASNVGLAVGPLFQDANGAVQFSPSTKLLNSYDSVNDIRFPTFYRTSPRPLLAKYGVITALPTTENFVYDIKMLRTSEMYLIRAEAYAETNQLALAAADLDALRAQRIAGYTPQNFADKETLINEILLERYRELAFEGHRYFDLKRRNLPIERLLADVQNNNALRTLAATDPRYLLPIPQQEIFANPNIQQNPGY
jgi:starch-binding outer membrane protein, SusD/RagB family